MELALVANSLFKFYHHPSDGLKVVIVLLDGCGGVVRMMATWW
jgi:hypothetical protein